MANAPTSRMATPDDETQILDTLTEAFLTDPFWVYFMGDPDREGFALPSAVRACFEAEASQYIRCGHSHMIDDRAAALWSPPGIVTDETDFFEQFGIQADASKLEAAFEQFLEVGAFRPEVPFFYLHLIGAVDRARGQGLGSVLLERVTTICDAEGWPAFLEASTPRAAALYERHGFEELAVIEFAPGVALRPMLRTPA